MIPVWHGKQIVNNPADSTLDMKYKKNQIFIVKKNGSGLAGTVSLGLSPSLESSSSNTKKTRVCELCFVGVLIDAHMWLISHGCVWVVEPGGKNVTRMCGTHTSHNSTHASVSGGSWRLKQVLSMNSTKSNHVALEDQCDSACTHDVQHAWRSVASGANVGPSRQRAAAATQAIHGPQLAALPCLCHVCVRRHSKGQKGCLHGRST